MKTNDWWPCCYSTDIAEARARELAAAKLDVPEEQIEVKRTGGCWLARVKENDDD